MRRTFLSSLALVAVVAAVAAPTASAGGHSAAKVVFQDIHVAASSADAGGDAADTAAKKRYSRVTFGDLVVSS